MNTFILSHECGVSSRQRPLGKYDSLDGVMHRLMEDWVVAEPATFSWVVVARLVQVWNALHTDAIRTQSDCRRVHPPSAASLRGVLRICQVVADSEVD